MGASGSGGSGGAGGEAGSDGNRPQEIAFYDPLADTLAVQPDEVRSLKVRTVPAGPYSVRFALLPGGDADAADDPVGATLSSNTAETNQLGIATVELKAPNSQTAFVVRASVGSDVTTRLTVTVQDPGVRSLIVHADYAGTRQPSNWTASVHTEATCAAVGDFTKDGPLKATAPFARDPEITDVPVGSVRAVSIHGDSMASGCVEVEISEGEVTPIVVPVNDLPLVLAEPVNLLFNIDTKNAAWVERIAKSREAALVRFRTRASNDDGTALLDAMAKVAGKNSSLFSTARSNEDWDTLVLDMFGPEPLTTNLKSWFDAGQEALNAPGVLQGTLQDNVLSIVTVAGSDGVSAGFGVSGEPATWEAQAGDQLLLNASLPWQFGSLVTALAEDPARAAVSGASDVPDALAERLSCDQLSRALANAISEVDELLFDSCNVPCGASLCREALATLWQQARAESSEDTELMHISATAVPTQISPKAELKSFEGDWTGQIVDTTASSPQLGGAWSGSG